MPFKGGRENQRGCDLPGVAEGAKVLSGLHCAQSTNGYRKPGTTGQKEWGHRRRTDRES